MIFSIGCAEQALIVVKVLDHVASPQTRIVFLAPLPTDPCRAAPE